MSGFQRINQPIVLARSTAAVSLTGTLAQTDLATITIPAGAMGPNGQVRVSALFSCTNNANNKNAYIIFGGTAFQATNMVTSDGGEFQRRIVNQNSVSAQVGYTAGVSPGTGVAAGVKTISAVNTANAVTLTLTGLLFNVADTITLESWLVELIPG